MELHEKSGATEALTLRGTGLPVIIVPNRGHKTGAIRKIPVMRVVDGRNYILMAMRWLELFGYLNGLLRRGVRARRGTTQNGLNLVGDEFGERLVAQSDFMGLIKENRKT